MINPMALIVAGASTKFNAYLDAWARAEAIDAKAAARAAALAIAEQSEKILDRIAYWREFGSVRVARPLALYFLNRLADRLNRATDEIERRLAV
jgi:hypothetical protein